ncbi:hypothetical protein QVA66_02560 [Staphylococcus chromogenes]|nr:hypothetical protein [Staphylococcus chromogenes]
MNCTSFRLIDGRVRNLTAHFQRLGLNADQERAARAALRAAPPGASNPLVWADGSVRHRPDRSFAPRITVDPIAHLDLRQYPTVKGPDLAWLSERLGISRQRGYDEGLLWHHGRIVEGIFSALITFDGTTASYSTHPRALSSTTLRPVLDYLAAEGFDLQPVAGFVHVGPLWLLNAFSGVRSAGGPDPAPVNQWLWEQAEEV